VVLGGLPLWVDGLSWQHNLASRSDNPEVAMPEASSLLDSIAVCRQARRRNVAMTAGDSLQEPFMVLVVGGGVAALEASHALREIASTLLPTRCWCRCTEGPGRSRRRRQLPAPPVDEKRPAELAWSTPGRRSSHVSLGPAENQRRISTRQRVCSRRDLTRGNGGLRDG
jgi:hypothetical protein